MKKRVIIIGGGAAGFFCAANLDQDKTEVIILEKHTKFLQKVKVSGGGRCNLTHNCSDPAIMSAAYPRGSRQLRQAFSRFFTSDTINWFLDRGLKTKSEADGRMFPVTDNSEDVIRVLEEEVKRKGFKLWTGSGVRKLSKTAKGFLITLENGNELEAEVLVIATGGYQKAGQYEWLNPSGHTIEQPVPSLFTFNVPDKSIHAIAGNSVEKAVVKLKGMKLETSGPLLFTHWGFSGPAVLKLSSLAARELAEKKYEFEFTINWTPGFKQDQIKTILEKAIGENENKFMRTFSPFKVSSAIWSFILNRAEIGEDFRWKDLRGKKMNVLIERLSNDEYHAKGKTTFKEEFVTCGGIKLSEIDFKTMQSKLQPGLFFCGEVLDIDGITGGYNFQAAWTTSWIAAQTINSLE